MSNRHVTVTPGATPPAGLLARRLALRAAGVVLLAGALLFPSAPKAQLRTRNGFSLEAAAIPVDEILHGGPPRDGIPALDAPKTVSAAGAMLRAHERVIGLEVAGEARAYPLSILVYHELVNDTLGGMPVLVSYCPLCGTGVVFDRRLDGRVLQFGVSGLLYKSDLLMFDRESDSLWSQIAARAVTGPRSGARLRIVPSRMARWSDWLEDHPNTTVLSRRTGHRRPYRSGSSPYGNYDNSTRILFPVDVDQRRHPKMPTLGLRFPNGTARAYPAEELARAGGRVTEQVADREVTVRYEIETGSFRWEVPGEVEIIEGFWFAWAAFHPDTTVFVAETASE